jgi:Domain of Unknown Function (DUF1080)
MSVLPARRGAISASRRRTNYLLAETWDDIALGTQFTVDGTAVGPRWTDFYWNQADGGRGLIVSDGSRVLDMRTPVAESSDSTWALLVRSNVESAGDIVLTAKLKTVAQLRIPSPNDWEVAWLYWNYSDYWGTGDDGTGPFTGTMRRCYYVILKPTGWELGKLETSIFAGHGGQRFLAEASHPRFPTGSWYTVRVMQVGATIDVSVDGRQLVSFVDGPGSQGTPAWGSPGERVYTQGAICLYNEDSQARFDDIYLSRH